MSEKIKVTLDGTAETMLQSFYARAKYSLKKGHKFYDAKAVELVNKIDYDFSSAEEDSTMSNGVIARTLVFDELVEDFIDRNSECTVVNIACGLDTRFYRMDNGKLRWYNLDLPETIAVRDHVFLKLFHGNMNYRTQTAVYNIIIKHFVPRFVDNTVIAYLCGVISLESRRTQPPPNTGAIRKTCGTFRRLFEIGFCFTNRHKRYVIVRIFAAFYIKGIIVFAHIRYM